ncbi:hypothetical protein Dda_4099 [Drechslerella dactyloides]|uniref:Uncharacterized protein n=1 Tax=Drechslerella dactyloides TaxID=74499 RepID=A0AAD6NK51_DREDA|nr:hypothetical protein Dda_4099 [Drechslerella dactyloides]
MAREEGEREAKGIERATGSYTVCRGRWPEGTKARAERERSMSIGRLGRCDAMRCDAVGGNVKERVMSVEG